MISRYHSLYLSGIGGSGLSAIACFMASRGHRVAGSDRAFELPGPEHPALSLLRSEGITIVSQDGTSLDETFDLMVMSTAVESGRPEVIRARELALPIKTRPEFLADIVNGLDSIAVAGTSGKSTTSGMLAHALKELEGSVNFIGGGRVKGLGNKTPDVSYLSGDSRTMVFEADESDGSIVNYHPQNTVILNLDLDHQPVRETSRMFRTLVSHTKHHCFYNADDRNLPGLMPKDAVTFSIETDSTFRADDLRLQPLGAEFSVNGVRFRLNVPGRHNVYNALAAIALLHTEGHPLKDVAHALAGFRGIRRRFDIHLNDESGLVIDDYAHNPHKISFMMEAVRLASPGPVCFVFQPHGFGPTKLMKDGYIRVFSEGLRTDDTLLLLPIFYAGGSTMRDISSEDLARAIRTNGCNAMVIEHRKDIYRHIAGYRCIVVFGARDESLSVLASGIAGALKSPPSG